MASSPPGHSGPSSDPVNLTSEPEAEPIAIIGLSLKFPQDATSQDSFWSMLYERRSARTEIPADRFNVHGYYHKEPGKPGMINVKQGHFVKEDVSLFDAPFFSITPTEANSMDPQQRWMLECSYRALENAGITIEQIAGTETSVHVGCWSGEFSALFHQDPELQARYQITGISNALIANRVSWLFDLRGTSVTLDTGCSSSMLALHQSCESLRNGDTSMGLVGGINLILNPDAFNHLSDFGMLNPDGISYAFDKRARGYARGEGIGVLILKRLSDALRDGNTIRAVIRGTASNQDGRTPGISQPSGEAQERLIRQVYAQAGLDLGETRYFEAHGTGTPIGDKLEAGAIGATFGPLRSLDQPLYVGAVKTNLGHLEGASGVAGIIKTVLVLERGVIPPNVWFEEANPAIKQDWNLKFPTEPTPWPSPGLRRASVNSFGYGGTNVHVVLDDARHYLEHRGLKGYHNTAKNPPLSLLIPRAATSLGSCDGNSESSFVMLRSKGHGRGPSLSSIESDGGPNPPPRPRLFVWSAHDEDGLRRMAAMYSEYISAHGGMAHTRDTDGREGLFLSRLAYTLASKRTRFPWRSFAVSGSRDELLQQLSSGGAPSKPIRAVTSPPIKIGFVFTGQGAQWHAMGRELMTYPVYRKTLEDADAYLRMLGCQWSLFDELVKDASTSNVDNPAYSQPLCTAVQIALARLLESWGLHAKAVVGHSSGEIAAAYCAGGLTLRAAMRVAYFRGVLSAELLERSCSAKQPTQACGMMAAAVSATKARIYLEKNGFDKVAVGCVNSPKNVTFTGDKDELVKLRDVLKGDAVFCQLLKVDNAYHSRYMEEVASVYRRCMGRLRENKRDAILTGPTMFSSTTGRQVAIEDAGETGYWVKNLVSPVLFSDAVSEMLSTAGLGVNYLLEVGPHGALRRYVKEIVESLPGGGDSVKYDATLMRNVSATETALGAAGRLFCAGLLTVNLNSVNSHDPASRDEDAGPSQMLVDLPEYPFNHSQGYWVESRISKNLRRRKEPRNDFLGSQVPDWNPADARWRMYIRLSEHEWIRDHEVTGKFIYPAAGMLVMAMEAVRQLADPDKVVAGYRLKEIVFDKALIIPTSPEGVETQLRVRAGKFSNFAGSASGWSDFELASFQNEQWLEHCRGSIRVEYEPGAASNSWTSGSSAAEKKVRAQRLLHEASELDRRCTVTLDSGSLYGMIEMIGIVFGPTFRTMTAVRQSSGAESQRDTLSSDAVAHVRVMRQGQSQSVPHIIHPTTLDGLLQTVFPALAATDRQGGMRTMLPSFLERVWISSSICHGVESSDATKASLKAHTTARKRGFREAECHMTVTDPSGGKLLAELGGFRLTQLSSGGGDGGTSTAKGAFGGNWRRLCFNVDWLPDVDLVDFKKAPSWFFEPTTAAGADAIAQASKDASLYADAEFMCFYFMSKALDHLDQGGAGPPAGGHLEKYVAWMRMHRRSIVELSSGHHPANSLAYGKPEWLELVHDEEYTSKVTDRIRDMLEAALLFRLGPVLPRILAGELDALELMFCDDLLTRLYRDGFGARETYARHERLIDALAHKRPGMKILEIGAGTGGTTVQLMETLSKHGRSEGEASEVGTARFGQYTYTDISPSFFEKARERFKEHVSRMKFKVLDIEKDPIKQGFEEEEYDLIVAANVLHATQNMKVTLANTRRLLKPGGRLLLFELTKLDMLGAGFAMGLLPGWWLGTEENRQWGPLMTKTDWDHILRASGFTGNDLGPVRGLEDDMAQNISVIMATALDSPGPLDGPAPVVTTAPAPPAVIVAAEGSPMQREVANELSRCLGTHHNTSAVPAWVRICSPWEASRVGVEGALCIFLPELESPFLSTVDEAGFDCLKKLVAAKNLVWVTKSPASEDWDPAFDLISGFARSVREEKGEGFSFVTAALEHPSSVLAGSSRVSSAGIAAKIFSIIKAAGLLSPSKRSGDADYEFVERGGMLCVGRAMEANYLNDEIAKRLVPAAQRTPEMQPLSHDRPVKLAIGSLGLLDTLRFVDVDEVTGFSQQLTSGPDSEVEIEVRVCGLNFFDVMTAMGQLPEDLGVECSGVVTRVGSAVTRFKPGDRVWAAQTAALRTVVRAPEGVVHPVPEHMSFEEAATLPIIYGTAYYSLFEVARLRQGETVLIHSASGGLGQAAINLARTRGVRILATVGTAEKRAFLAAELGIPEQDVFSSRDVESFVLGVERATGGRGVDVALNSLSGEALRATWERCMAPFGRFVEVGRRDISSFATLPMSPLARGVSFASGDVLYPARQNPARIYEIFSEVAALAESGVAVAPKPLHVYGFGQAEEAFRLMQSGKHIGKIVLRPEFGQNIPIVPDCRPKYRLKADATYVIAGGLGGLGRSLARLMVRRGAKHLLLLSRSGLSDSSCAFVTELRAMGATVVATPKCDVSKEEELAAVLNECKQTMPPIAGCVSAQMVLKVSAFGPMPLDDFYTAVAPKVKGSWNLHRLLPDSLDFFIMLSSTAGVMGSHGQSNYAAGNSYQDALARYRVARGQSAVSLALGMLYSVGFVAQQEQDGSALVRRLRERGYIPILHAEFLAMVDLHCDPASASRAAAAAAAAAAARGDGVQSAPLTPVDALRAQVVTGVEIPASLRRRGAQEPFAIRTSALFRPLHHMGIGRHDDDATGDFASAQGGSGSDGPGSLRAALAAAKSVAEAGTAVADALVAKLARTLSVPRADVDPSRPLHVYGVDSLVAVELRSWLAREALADVAVLELMGGASISALGGIIAAKSQVVPSSVST